MTQALVSGQARAVPCRVERAMQAAGFQRAEVKLPAPDAAGYAALVLMCGMHESCEQCAECFRVVPGARRSEALRQPSPRRAASPPPRSGRFDPTEYVRQQREREELLAARLGRHPTPPRGRWRSDAADMRRTSVHAHNLKTSQHEQVRSSRTHFRGGS